MVHVYKDMMQDEADYGRLCAKYKESMVYKRYLPEINGEHHNSLREREKVENASDEHTTK